MRQYAGNRAPAIAASAPGPENKLAEKVLMSAPNQVDQLGQAYGYDLAEMLARDLQSARLQRPRPSNTRVGPMTRFPGPWPGTDRHEDKKTRP
jgi:hypothetical protein